MHARGEDGGAAADDVAGAVAGDALKAGLTYSMMPSERVIMTASSVCSMARARIWATGVASRLR
jgi:hypothetical protein